MERMLCIFNLVFKNEFLFQIVKMNETSGLYGSVIGDFNQDDATVFGRGAMTHWKPVLLVSSAHMRLFAYLVIYR